MANSVYVHFEDLSRPLLLNNCSELIDHFPLVFPGWEIDTKSSPGQLPIITINLDKEGSYRLEAEWLKKTASYRDEVDTLCALVAKVVKARTLEDMNLLCLHGAAVKINSTLIIFPNKYRAGKSVLATCLAAAGYQVYSDDVLPISLETGEGVAPSIAPRLRAPYPDNLDAQTRQFIESRVALKGERYHYLDLTPDLLAPRDKRAPIGAFVFLEREEGVRPELRAISESDVLRQVVWQNFAREIDAHSILGRLGKVVSQAQSFTLRYDRADAAVELLGKHFHRQDSTDERLALRTLELQNTDLGSNDVPAGYLLRRKGISEIKSDSEAFLADTTGSAIHHLNPVGSAIWSLLAQPITIEQIIELLLVAFPDVEANQVEADVRKLIKSLKAKNLLLVGRARSKSEDPPRVNRT
ncbi:MAG: PqqD family protein [Gammaproteobacteria bacterium]|nr:PqqD family protein [Gammaproteobacteria bacterium]